MAQYNKETYNVNTLFGGPAAFRQVAELANAKYDTARYREFGTTGRIFRTPKWEGSITSNGIAIAAAVLSHNGQKPPRGARGFGKYAGNIPMIGHMFNITADDIMTLREQEADGGDPIELQQFQYTSRFDENIRGMHNRRNMFVFQGLSSGYITADAQNNGEAVQDVVIDLGLKAENRLRPAIVWSDPTSDPIADLLAWQETISEDPNAPSITNVLMSKSLIKKLAMHPKVREAIALKKYIGSPNPQAIPLTKNEVLMGLNEYYDILPIMEIDEKARVQIDGKYKTIQSFDENAVVFCTPANFFEFVGCRNIYDDDTNPNVAKARLSDNTTVIVEHFSNPFNIATSMESFWCPVPRDVNSWFVARVDTTAPWGSREDMLNTRMNAVKTLTNPERVIVSGEEYARAAVINALNSIGETTGTNMKLANVQAKVDTLTEGQTTSLVAALNP